MYPRPQRVCHIDQVPDKPTLAWVPYSAQILICIPQNTFLMITKHRLMSWLGASGNKPSPWPMLTQIYITIYWTKSTYTDNNATYHNIFKWSAIFASLDIFTVFKYTILFFLKNVMFNLFHSNYMVCCLKIGILALLWSTYILFCSAYMDDTKLYDKVEGRELREAICFLSLWGLRATISHPLWCQLATNRKICMIYTAMHENSVQIWTFHIDII